ncbi:MAG: GreA/GreB family elongation factor [Pseudomonadota bacterium]|nr:GreA/GreB family elongation factor [Pseudomonadota bacterium]
MSVAFRRESDEEHLEPKFELPIPPGPNYVTPAGLAQIEVRVAELEAAIEAGGTEETLKALKRDLRYWHQRQSSVIPAPAPAPGGVGIGSTVTFTLRDKRRTMTITGHDEADPANGKIAFSSPLARTLLGLCAGDFADFADEEEAIEINRVKAA